MAVVMNEHAKEHSEVMAALVALGDARLGRAQQADRGSALPHLGIAVPVLRARVHRGFGFSSRPWPEPLLVWDALWRTSPCADVLFAALYALTPRVRKPPVSPDLWPVLRHWSARIDNWCHSDALSALYSRLLEAHFDTVYPQLLDWNRADALWLRRLSLTSLVHYTGKNAVFLAPDRMLPLLHNCAGDARRPVQLALGWVLRELARDHRVEATAFVEQLAGTLSAAAFARALERHPAAERARLRAWRAGPLQLHREEG
jgi:3-methyladenine DNA glycosylase AlkD